MIHPIYIAALVPTLLCLCIFGYILKRSERGERLFISVLFMLELPMHFVSSHVVRAPFNRWFDTVINPQDVLGLLLRSFQAPVVEESFKLWLIFIALFLSRMTAQNAVRIGMAVGLSFGLSEVWSLAYTYSLDPQWRSLHWYQFGGFMQERFFVAPIHGVFAAAASRQIVKGGRYIVIGILSGMGLHYLANFPIFVMRLDVGHLPKMTWAVLLALYVGLYTLAMYILLMYFTMGKDTIRKMFSGYARCPECHEIYKRPKVRLNFGPMMSYEICACCKKPHFIRLKDMLESAPPETKPESKPESKPEAAPPA